ncbi:hypothetical protein Tco_1422913 [Tanacetum coccineum]
MAASAIAISFDSSDESVGSPPSRVILFGDIPTVISSTSVVAPETSTIAPVISSAAPVVKTNLVASPAGLCGLVPYSGPDSSDGPPSQDPYVATVARCRSRVTPCPSSSSEFPIALVTAQPEIRRRSAILIRHREAIPFGRPYHTHLNGPRKLLTAWKRFGPLPAHRLTCRHALPRSSEHRSSSSSSSSDSSPVHSSESSSGDSSERHLHSSSHSARLSHKRCRSLIDSVPSSSPVMGSLAPTRADLLPPRKRFIDLYSSEASIERDTRRDPIETEVDMELGIGDWSDVLEYHVEIDPRDVRLTPRRMALLGHSRTMRDFYHHMSEVRIDRIVGIETAQRRLEADQLIARGQRVSMIERIDSLRLENLKVRAMLDIERDCVNSLRLYMSLSQEEFRQVRRDRDDTWGRLRRLESYVKRRLGFRP